MDSNSVPGEESEAGLSRRGSPFGAKAGKKGDFRRENPCLDVWILVHIFFKKWKPEDFGRTIETALSSQSLATFITNNYQMGLIHLWLCSHRIAALFWMEDTMID